MVSIVDRARFLPLSPKRRFYRPPQPAVGRYRSFGPFDMTAAVATRAYLAEHGRLLRDYHLSALRMPWKMWHTRHLRDADLEAIVIF